MDKKSLIDRYLEALEKAGDITLRYYYQTKMLKDSLLSADERKQLVDEVTNQVISNISMTVDVSEVIDAIDEIKRRLDDLFK